MKKFLIILSIIFLFSFSLAAQSDYSDLTESDITQTERKAKSLAGYADIPASKRPKTPDKKKVEEAEKKDESEKTVEEYKKTLKFGIPSEIGDLIDKLVKNEDPRFADNLYDLFQESRSSDIKNKILQYFTKLEDPCLEDYAVMIVNDPFDERSAVVKACLKYISAVKCTAAVPAVFQMIENEDEQYFNDALNCAGEIGGVEGAVALSEYLDREDLSDPQKQSLMRVLGKLHAVETWDKLVDIAEDEDQNLFVRMYACEAIGAMEKEDSVPVLQSLYEKGDPNIRQYTVKGLSYFPNVIEARSVIIQAVRDDHVKVRLEAVSVVKDKEIKEAVPYLIYRAEHDNEEKVKQESYAVIAFLNTKEGNDFLLSRVTEKKVADSLKAKACEVLLKEGHTGEKEILDLAFETLDDDRRKNLRYAVGRQLAKYPKPSFDQVCVKYLESKDSTTVGIGLDIYQNGKYNAALPQLEKIAEDKKQSTNSRRAKKMLGKED